MGSIAAYYGIFSVVPITYLTVVIAGIFVDASELIVRLEERLDELLGLLQFTP